MTDPAIPAGPAALTYDPARGVVDAIDQSLLPHELRRVPLATVDEFAHAIRAMQVRGAPLIGIAAAYGLALAVKADPSPAAEAHAAATLLATRPTAVDLAWAVARVRRARAEAALGDGPAAALREAQAIEAEQVGVCWRIGVHGRARLDELWRAKQARTPGAKRLDVLTHCNAGWLATGQWGTALSPVYQAHMAGMPVHVWVDETRPRGQGASLTAWELAQAGVPHTLIADTMAGHVLQTGRVDVCLVGTDRTTRAGDVCNKIGTYQVALAAFDNGVPFYPCVPASSIDWTIADGVREVPIEQRHASEVTHVRGRTAAGERAEVRIAPEGTQAANFAFDITPARLVTGLITEHGIFEATEAGLAALSEQVHAR